MITIVAINQPDNDHLQEVIADMIKLGAPVIRAVKDDCYGLLCAIEGSHRLAACKALGITPIIEIVDYDSVIDADAIGIYPTDVTIADDHIGMTAGDLCNARSGGLEPYNGCPFYNFE
jgi:hypothetical protein